MTTLIVLILSIGLTASATGSKSAAVEYFESVKNPKYFETQFAMVEDPPVMPRLPERLRLERSWQTGNKCGPVALYFLLKLHGIDKPFNEVLEAVKVTEKGANLKMLQDAAEQFGLNTDVIEVTPSEFPRLPYASIVHWDTTSERGQPRDHFDVFIEDMGNGQYRIIDTTSCIVKSIPFTAASQMTSGYALIARGAIDRNGWMGVVLWTCFGMVLFGNVYCGFRQIRKRVP